MTFGDSVVGSVVIGNGFFVGRADELARFGSLLAGVAAGVGAAVLVEGEQGIGKTSLLRRALGGAEDAGCALAWGAGDELSQRSPLWLMRECLETGGLVAVGGGRQRGDDYSGADCVGPPPSPGWLPILAGLVPPGDPVAVEIEQLLARVERWCAVSPVVLVAEDLQWADEASLLVWQRLARVVGQMPLLLVGSSRPGPGTGDADRLRRGLLSRGETVLRLGGLGAQEVSDLVERVAGGRPGRRLAGVVRGVAGNPLYARELVDALVRDGRVLVEAGVAELTGPEGAGVPTSLAGVIERRLSALPQEAAEVLRWAAVLGQEFSATDLVVVTGCTGGHLMKVIGQAVTAGVVGETAGPGRRLAFRHRLIRQVLYDGLPGALRAALHMQAARALAAAGAAPERVAAQLAVVPEWANGWPLEWLAGVVPVLSYRAPNVAAELLGRALNLLPDGDERQEALEAALVTVAFLLARDEEVERVGGRLVTYARDRDRAAEAAWRVGYAKMRTGWPGNGGEAVAWLDKALQRPGTSDVWNARLHALRALAMCLAAQPGTPRAARDALALAEAAQDRLAAGYALLTMCLVDFYVRRMARALAHIDRALNVTGDDPQATDLVLLLLSFQAQALQELDRHDEARATIRKAMVLGERTGIPRFLTVVMAEDLFRLGLWDDALVVLEQAATLPGPSYGPLQLHRPMALIAVHRDDKQAAEHLADPADQETSVFGTLHFRLLARALAAEQAGRPGEAVAVLRRVMDPVLGLQMVYRYLLLPDLVRLALATEDAATAAAAAQVAAQEAELEPLPVKVAAADHCRGLVEGDPAPVLAAAAYYGSASRPLERAQSLEDAAVLQARRGDLTAARQASAEAVMIYQGLGARWNPPPPQARLSCYGIRLTSVGRRARPTRGWEALTPTEVKVARLIGNGLSNPDIAAELFLSRNTVQTHVSHILAKLTARSRNEIIHEVLRHPAVKQETKTLLLMSVTYSTRSGGSTTGRLRAQWPCVWVTEDFPARADQGKLPK
jgi:DNA-binding CsgD family transcriptional regulator/tetratricopeptide (TPR) repeat protein